MDKKTVFVKTELGESESLGNSDQLYGDTKRIFHLIDDESTVSEITKRAPPSLRDSIQEVLQELVNGGYIRDVNASDDEPVKSSLKFATPAFKMSKPKAAITPSSASASEVKTSITPQQSMQESKPEKKDDLDFSFITSPVNPAQGRPESKIIPESQAPDRINSQALQEAAAKAAKMKAYEDAKIKAQIEVAARAKIEAEARIKKEADAKLRAEQEAKKARAEAEVAKARIEAEVRARLEAELKAKQEAEARIKREVEAKVKQEAEAKRIKAEQEAEKLRLELEAAKAKAEAELRIRLEAEARARAELEARLKREAEAERLKLEKEHAEIEVARIKAEAELKLREEAEIRVRAALDARIKADTLAKQAEERRLMNDVTGNTGKNPVAFKHQTDPGDKLRQSFVESFGQSGKKPDATTGSFKLEQFSLLNTGRIAAYAAETSKKETMVTGSGSKVKAAIEERKRKEAEENQKQNEQENVQLKDQQAEAAKLKAQQEAEAARLRAEQEKARLKAEHEAYRLKIQQEEAEAQAAVEAQKLAEQQSRQWEEAQQRAAFLAQAEKERISKEAAESRSLSMQKKSRSPRKSLPIGKLFIGLIVLSLISVVGLPYVLPLDEYIAPLEAGITAQIKQPVHIKKITVAVLPMPKLVLHSVTLGKLDEVKAGDVEINFDFSALFATTRSINELRFNNAVLSGSSFDKTLASILGIASIEQYPVAHMGFSGLQINNPGINLPVLSGRADFDGQGKFLHAYFKSTDSKFGVEMQPLQNAMKMDLSLHESSLPIFGNIKFNDLSVTATVSNGEAVLSDFFAHIFGGTITGKGRLSWNSGWKLQGQLNARNVDLKQMLPEYGISGELLGEVSLSMSSSELAQLDMIDRDFLIEGSFEGKDGVIPKLDFETVARLGARQGVAGHTNFSSLEGTVKVNSNGQRVFVSKLASGSSTITGLIDIDLKQQISGKFQVGINGVNGTIPLRLSGTTQELILESGH